eukprot:5812574-Pyramimonas_sp.AAC.2
MTGGERAYSRTRRGSAIWSGGNVLPRRTAAGFSGWSAWSARQGGRASADGSPGCCVHPSSGTQIADACTNRRRGERIYPHQAPIAEGEREYNRRYRLERTRKNKSSTSVFQRVDRGCPGWGSGVRVPHLFVVDLEVAERHFDVALGAVDVPED